MVTPANDTLWQTREQILQSLYVSPSVQSILPNEYFGQDPIDDRLLEFIKQRDLPRLGRLLKPFWRGAATCFFNLPSARRLIEQTLDNEVEAIRDWLAGEQSVRLAFDFFGDDGDPIVGYGILHLDPAELRFTKAMRVVLQRTAEDGYVLWTAFPLLAPYGCWLDAYDYAAHVPSTSLSPLFYYFLNGYMSVTSGYLGVDAVIQGTADFFRYESQATFQELADTLRPLRPHELSPEDEHHISYELSIRCLDETLPEFYIAKPTVFVEALQRSLGELERGQRPSN